MGNNVSHPKGILDNKYQIIQDLDHFRSLALDQDSEVCIKYFTYPGDEAHIQQTKEAIKHSLTLDHINLVKCHSVHDNGVLIDSKKGKEKKKGSYIVQEHCQNGSLSLLIKQTGGLQEAAGKYYFK